MTGGKWHMQKTQKAKRGYPSLPADFVSLTKRGNSTGQIGKHTRNLEMYALYLDTDVSQYTLGKNYGMSRQAVICILQHMAKMILRFNEKKFGTEVELMPRVLEDEKQFFYKWLVEAPRFYAHSTAITYTNLAFAEGGFSYREAKRAQAKRMLQEFRESLNV